MTTTNETENRSVRDNPPLMAVKTFMHRQYYEQAFDDITDSGRNIEYSERYALAEMARCYLLIDEATADINERGVEFKVKGDRGFITRTNQYVAIRKDAQNQLYKYLSEFGLTVASRKATKQVEKSAAGSGDGFDQFK